MLQESQYRWGFSVGCDATVFSQHLRVPIKVILEVHSLDPLERVVDPVGYGKRHGIPLARATILYRQGWLLPAPVVHSGWGEGHVRLKADAAEPAALVEGCAERALCRGRSREAGPWERHCRQ